MTCQCSSAGTSKNMCKHIVYNRPDLKLKEAEKTIANKDVIINMLKSQVKKLEQSYMNNMKETENFRYKYCLASEQMKRMRCCSEYCYEKVKPKDIPLPLCNTQNIAISAPPTPPICRSAPSTPPSCSAQDALNSEKILKSNKQLMELLNKVAVEKGNEEAEHLQREIARLQQENNALLEALNRYKNKDDFIKRESNVQTNKKDNDAQERLSKICSISNDVERVETKHPSIPSLGTSRDSEFSRRVSFFSGEQSRDATKDDLKSQASRNTQEAARSFHDMIEKETCQGVNYTQLEQDNCCSDEQVSIRSSRIREGSGSSVSCVNQDCAINTNPIQELCPDDGSCRVSKEIQTTSSEALCDCPPIEDEEAKLGSLYSNPASRINSYRSEGSSASVDIPSRKSQESRPSDATMSIRSRQSQGSRPSDVTMSIRSRKSQESRPSDAAKERSVSVDRQSQGSRPSDVTKESSVSVDRKSQGCRPSDVTMSIRSRKSQESRPSDATKERSVSADRQSQGSRPSEVSMSIRSDSNQKQMSEAPITPFNSASLTTLEDDNNERASAMLNRGTKMEKKNCSAPLLRKLAEIKEKINDMSEKQDTACRELAIVRDKMAVTHETTENCKFEISKLKETVEEQRVEFLARFEENKEITDDLKQSNQEIRTDLEEVKGKIETLFQAVDELKNNQGGGQCDAKDNCTQRSESDDVLTLEECHIEIERNKSDAEVKPSQDLNKLDDCECPPDKKLDCVTDLVNQYKKISKDMSSMCPLIPSCMKVGDEDTQSYLDKIREDNMKLKATISSVIEHLSEKMKDMNEAIPPKADDQSEYLPAVPTASKRSCQLSVGVSTEATCKSECATNTPIEEIFSASSRGRDLSVSSGSKSPCCCNCDGSQATLEDIYRAVRCSCERRQKFLKKKCNAGSKCIKSAPSSRSSIKTVKSNKSQASSCRCLVGVGKRISREQNSIIQSLENYVTYLHTQLRTISSIEKEIEDMRTNIKDPKL